MIDAAKLRRLLDAFANNKESATPAGSSIESCPLAQCEVSSLTVTCAHHSERKMRLDLLCDKPTRNGKDYVLQVVSPKIQNALIFTRKIDIPSSLPKWAFFGSDDIPDIGPMSDAESDAFLKRLLAEHLKAYRALQTNRVDEVLPLFDERNRNWARRFTTNPAPCVKKFVTR